jgi:hypothetical protein
MLGRNKDGSGTGEYKADDDDDKEDVREAMVVRTMRIARNKLLAANLEGTITISRTVGVYTSKASCFVSNGEKKTIEELHEDELDHKYTRIISMFDGAIANLTKRAKKWEDNEALHATMKLSREYTLGMTDPIFGVVGFSMAVSLALSLESLVRYRRELASIQGGSAHRFSMAGANVTSGS